MGMLNSTAKRTDGDRVPGMRFGTYYFQAPPWLSHEEVVHRELGLLPMSMRDIQECIAIQSS